MISNNAIYRKSAAGAQAIATRKPPLAPRLRALLIMVDGTRSVAALSGLVQGSPPVDSLLAELQTMGLVEEVAPTADARPTGPGPLLPALSPAEIPQHAAAIRPTLVQAQRQVTRVLIELLGPSADRLCLQIEATRDFASLEEHVRRAREVVRGMRGQETANQFGERIEPYLHGS